MTVVAQIPVPVGDGCIVVRELTFAEVRAWVNESAASTTRDPLHAMAFDDFGLDELARMCAADAEALEAYSPSQLAPVVEAARKLNPHFFQVRATLLWAVRHLLPDASPTTLTETPADSSPVGTPAS